MLIRDPAYRGSGGCEVERPISFVIRVTAFDQEGHVRGQIEHVPTGKTAYFRDLAQAEAFMHDYLPQIAADAPPSRLPTGGAVSSLFSFRRRRASTPEAAPAEAPVAGGEAPATGGPMIRT